MHNPSIIRMRQKMIRHEAIITQDSLCSYLEFIQTWRQAWGPTLWGSIWPSAENNDKSIRARCNRLKILTLHHRWSKKHLGTLGKCISQAWRRPGQDIIKEHQESLYLEELNCFNDGAKANSGGRWTWFGLRPVLWNWPLVRDCTPKFFSYIHWVWHIRSPSSSALCTCFSSWSKHNFLL